MAQNITLNILGRSQNVVAQTPEEERNMRIATEEINKAFSQYNEKFPNVPDVDKAAFTALNQAITKLMLKDSLKSANAEVSELCKKLDEYLQGEI